MGTTAVLCLAAFCTLRIEAKRRMLQENDAPALARLSSVFLAAAVLITVLWQTVFSSLSWKFSRPVCLIGLAVPAVQLCVLLAASAKGKKLYPFTAEESLGAVEIDSGRGLWRQKGAAVTHRLADVTDIEIQVPEASYSMTDGGPVVPRGRWDTVASAIPVMESKVVKKKQVTAVKVKVFLTEDGKKKSCEIVLMRGLHSPGDKAVLRHTEEAERICAALKKAKESACASSQTEEN